MSLRVEIRDAVDEVMTPAPNLVTQIDRFVTANARRRVRAGSRGVAHWRSVMRGSLALVAVLVVVVLVAAIFVGGRLVSDWKSFQTSPAVQAPKSQLQQLEERPLRIPLYSSLKQCTAGPYNSDSSLGSGPVYMDGGSSTVTAWGRYIYFDAYSDQTIKGPILIRGRDLTIGIHMIFVGPFAGGPVQGTDTVDGQSYEQRTEVVLSTSQTSPGALGPTSPHKYVWDFIGGLPVAAIGPSLIGYGAGWQIDGPNFSEIVLAC